MASSRRGSAKERSAARQAAKVNRGNQGAIEAVGWWFWIGGFVVLAPIGIFVAILYRDPYHESYYYPIMLGVFGGAVGAGVLSVLVNYVLERRARKRKLKARKESKKRR
jgi:uncharacterized integral membrane protein